MPPATIPDSANCCHDPSSGYVTAKTTANKTPTRQAAGANHCEGISFGFFITSTKIITIGLMITPVPIISLIAFSIISPPF